MKTRCAHCQTTFRVTPEQLKARAGKVRCGQCQTVFNALDNLLEESLPATPVPPPMTQQTVEVEVQVEAEDTAPTFTVLDPTQPGLENDPTDTDPTDTDPRIDILLEPVEAPPALSESQAQALGKATGLILPRETTEIPGYSKWTEGVMATAFAPEEEKSTRWPFILAAILLIIGLVGQMAFHFRSEIAVSAPALRPLLEALSQALDTDIPLPRHVDLVSIEASDLQNDATQGNLLVLNATVRNRAGYPQAYPSLELSLTDTQDAAIARRVFSPAEYLSAKQPADPSFAANSDIAIRLLIEAKDISASGYRLYVFYP
jgi:predicted Zn finger-like uncharacterized protein